METVIYLIRHSEQYKDEIINNDKENTQEINERIILSVEGEKKQKN